MLRTFTTTVRAIDPADGELKTWGGDRVQAISWAEAQHILNTTERGYMKVDGELVAEIPCKPGTFKPDWDGSIDYQTPRLN